MDLGAYRGRPSQVIRVQADDDLEVIRPRVRVLSVEGVMLEEGEAARGAAPADWTYPTQASLATRQAVIVGASAFDRPGNQIAKHVDHVFGPRGGNAA